MPLKDANAPRKRDFYADAIKRLQIEMQNDLGKWDVFTVEEKALKLQSDYEKFEAKNMTIACDEGADDEIRKQCEAMRMEIDSLFFSLKPLTTQANGKGKRRMQR